MHLSITTVCKTITHVNVCCASKMVFLILPSILNSTFIGLFSRKGPNKDSTAEPQMTTLIILLGTVLKCIYMCSVTHPLVERRKQKSPVSMVEPLDELGTVCQSNLNAS